MFLCELYLVNQNLISLMATFISCGIGMLRGRPGRRTLALTYVPAGMFPNALAVDTLRNKI
jgi:hypothetical protein